MRTALVEQHVLGRCARGDLAGSGVTQLSLIQINYKACRNFPVGIFFRTKMNARGRGFERADRCFRRMMWVLAIWRSWTLRKLGRRGTAAAQAGPREVRVD